jgi:sulfofructosephosphate aldolase
MTTSGGRPSVRDLSPIAGPSGTFGMLAIDQRESLRTLLVGSGHGSSDADLTAFKVAVARALSPVASGILVDRDYGVDAIVNAHAVAEGCGLIVAVDRLIQQPGGPLEGSELDRSALHEGLLHQGAKALKFLVVWRPDQPAELRGSMVADFIAACRSLGLLSVLEGLVQVPGSTDPDVFDAAVLDAATEFASFEPDLYKTHLPTSGAGDPAEIEDRSREITNAIGRPWVVLSAGVPVERFAAGVQAACRGGASGFLAGRGVWGPSIRTADPEADLETAAHARLVELVAIAEASARPWWDGPSHHG